MQNQALGIHNDDVLLGFGAVQTRRYMPTFRRNIPSPSSPLKMETVCFSETLASTNESTRRQNPEEEHYHLHRRESLKSHLEFSKYIEI
jgi:hypothetical protein